MKTCSRCKKNKPRAEFYKGYGPSGLGCQCKLCANKTSKASCQRHRARYNERARLKGLLPKSKEYSKLYNSRNRKQHAQFQIEYRLKNKGKVKAHSLLNSALLAGKLVKQDCEVCGKKRTHGHHDNYNKPLDVRWLCIMHHQEHHRKERERISCDLHLRN